MPEPLRRLGGVAAVGLLLWASFVAVGCKKRPASTDSTANPSTTQSTAGAPASNGNSPVIAPGSNTQSLSTGETDAGITQQPPKPEPKGQATATDASASQVSASVPGSENLSQSFEAALKSSPFLISASLCVLAIALVAYTYFGPSARAKKERLRLAARLSHLDGRVSMLNDKLSQAMKAATKADGSLDPVTISESSLIPAARFDSRLSTDQAPHPGRDTASQPRKSAYADFMKDEPPVQTTPPEQMPELRIPSPPAELPSLDPPKPVDPYTGEPSTDYNTARAMEPPQGEEWFYEHYENHRSLSCQNLEQFRNQHVELRFEESSRGVFLEIRHKGQLLLFPQITDDIIAAKRSLEGVFIYPSVDCGVLALKKPALANQNASGEFILVENGEVDRA